MSKNTVRQKKINDACLIKLVEHSTISRRGGLPVKIHAGYEIEIRVGKGEDKRLFVYGQRSITKKRALSLFIKARKKFTEAFQSFQIQW